MEAHPTESPPDDSGVEPLRAQRPLLDREESRFRPVESKEQYLDQLKLAIAKLDAPEDGKNEKGLQSIFVLIDAFYAADQQAIAKAWSEVDKHFPGFKERWESGREGQDGLGAFFIHDKDGNPVRLMVSKKEFVSILDRILTLEEKRETRPERRDRPRRDPDAIKSPSSPVDRELRDVLDRLPPLRPGNPDEKPEPAQPPRRDPAASDPAERPGL